MNLMEGQDNDEQSTEGKCSDGKCSDGQGDVITKIDHNFSLVITKVFFLFYEFK